MKDEGMDKGCSLKTKRVVYFDLAECIQRCEIYSPGKVIIIRPYGDVYQFRAVWVQKFLEWTLLIKEKSGFRA